MKKHSLDEETVTKIYLAFNKNVIGVLKYISNEIDNLKIICNQTEIDIEKARIIYYKCNKDVVESISFILEGKHKNMDEEEEVQHIVKEETKPLFDETKTYKHIIEYGKDLLYDEENDYLFDAESKDFFSTMKSAKTKIQELRCIVDSKDIIIQNQKKTMKKEKIENILKKVKHSQILEIWNIYLKYPKKTPQSNIQIAHFGYCFAEFFSDTLNICSKFPIFVNVSLFSICFLFSLFSSFFFDFV
jgi:hypothetical protein